MREILATTCKGRQATPHLYETDADIWLSNGDLGKELFGPLCMVVCAKNTAQMIRIAKSLEGQLTCTLQMDQENTGVAQQLMSVLERKAGRVLANGFATGVEVADSVVHGGPYPASINFGVTSVGTLSIRRFLRPVCYQNMPDDLLPITT